MVFYMKKVMLFIMIILFVFTVTGCKNGDATRGIRHAGFILSDEEFNCSAFLPASEEDTMLKENDYIIGLFETRIRRQRK
mgnify:CR=1 FL=1